MYSRKCTKTRKCKWAINSDDFVGYIDSAEKCLKILTHLNINTVDFRFEEMYSIHQLLIQSRLQSKRILFDVLNSKTLDNQ